MDSLDNGAAFYVAVADGFGYGDDWGVLFEELDDAFFFVLSEVLGVEKDAVVKQIEFLVIDHDAVGEDDMVFF